ncbi:hypothetical protein DRE_03300 [Drechslerella stenobrocha 248]|uniref:Major facilitator superfamily (MFS) profile domain-containing protein n=1 Tax=Drechslerella stenobrocha 248 TaxID=1043628 RepID=W7IF38_9PEZI|nr:hypothetical protein DRE_03300 [Drechslerella stenobrocha 248]
MGPRSPRSNGFDSWRQDGSLGSAAHSEFRQPSPNPGGDPNNNFVQLHSSKSAVELSAHESVAPVAIVTILFFLWGFASGLLSVVLNNRINSTIRNSDSALIGLHSAYYGGYFVGPVTFSGYIFRHYGFRITFITGLVIYGVGCIVFWPCGVLQTYPGFIISNFISGLGVATIEVAANLFVAICGPPHFWEARLNLSQGAQAIGNVIAPILADSVLFRRDESTSNSEWLISVQWGYLGVAFFDFALALFFWYVPLPECTDAEITRVNRWRPENSRPLSEKRPIAKRLLGRHSLLLLGVWAQFCYTGVQEIVTINGTALIRAFSPDYLENANTFIWSADGLLAFGRLAGGIGMFYIPARLLYLFCTVGCIVTSFVLFGLQYGSDNGQAIVALRVLLPLFESICFPTIFAISLRGLSGRNVKWGASWEVLGVCGGAVWPPVFEAIRNRYHDDMTGIRVAWALVVVLLVAGIGVQSFLVNFMPCWRHRLDGLSKPELREKYEADGTIGGRLNGANDHVA